MTQPKDCVLQEEGGALKPTGLDQQSYRECLGSLQGAEDIALRWKTVDSNHLCVSGCLLQRAI